MTNYGEFSKVFGPTPRNRILEYFLAMRSTDLAIGDIAAEAELNRATTYNTMEKLLEEKLVLPSRKVGKTQLYKLNRDSPVVKILLKIFSKLLDKIMEEYTKPKKKKVAAVARSY